VDYDGTLSSGADVHAMSLANPGGEYVRIVSTGQALLEL